jgi:hypothetical protein
VSEPVVGALGGTGPGLSLSRRETRGGPQIDELGLAPFLERPIVCARLSGITPTPRILTRWGVLEVIVRDQTRSISNKVIAKPAPRDDVLTMSS